MTGLRSARGQIPFDYTFGRLYNLPLTSSGRRSRVEAAVAEHGLAVDPFTRGELEPRISTRDLPRLHALVTDRQSVWLASHPWCTDPEGPIPQALAVTLNLRQRWTFAGIRVYLYV